jgi:hypothetical protein
LILDFRLSGEILPPVILSEAKDPEEDPSQATDAEILLDSSLRSE